MGTTQSKKRIKNEINENIRISQYQIRIQEPSTYFVGNNNNNNIIIINIIIIIII